MKTRFFTLVIRDLWHTVLNVVRLWRQITIIYFCLKQRKEESMSFQIQIDGDKASIELSSKVRILVEGEPIKNLGSNIRPVQQGNASSVYVSGHDNAITVATGTTCDNDNNQNAEVQEDEHNGEE